MLRGGEGRFPLLSARANPLRCAQTPLFAQGQRCSRHTKVRNDAFPFPTLQGHREGPVLRRSQNLSFPLGSQGIRFSTLCTMRASNNRLSRSPIQRTRLGETRWEEAPGPCAQECTDGARLRSPPPSVHPNSADPLRQAGTERLAPSRVPLALRKVVPVCGTPGPPRLPATPSLLRGTCSEIRVSETKNAAGGQRPRTAPSSQSVIGALAGCDERPIGMELGSDLPGAVGSREPRVQVAAPTPAAAPRRKTMRPPGALGPAPAAPPASRPAPPLTRLRVAAANPALGCRLDAALPTPLQQ